MHCAASGKAKGRTRSFCASSECSQEANLARDSILVRREEARDVRGQVGERARRERLDKIGRSGAGRFPVAECGTNQIEEEQWPTLVAGTGSRPQTITPKLVNRGKTLVQGPPAHHAAAQDCLRLVMPLCYLSPMPVLQGS